MVEIDQCLQRVLNCNSLVQYQKLISIQLHHHVNVMQYFTFLSDNSKQDAATTTAHSKRLIALLKDKKVLTSSLSKIWENNDGCDRQYRCAPAVYLMSVMPQCYSVTID